MWFLGDSACDDWESMGWMAGCLGLSGPVGGVWIGPCCCRVQHHLLGFGADFLGVLLGQAEQHVCHCGGTGHSGAMEL